MFVVFNETMTMPNVCYLVVLSLPLSTYHGLFCFCPQITFCMFKEHAWSHFNRTGLTAADIDATAEVNDGKGKVKLGGGEEWGQKWPNSQWDKSPIIPTHANQRSTHIRCQQDYPLSDQWSFSFPFLLSTYCTFCSSVKHPKRMW